MNNIYISLLGLFIFKNSESINKATGLDIFSLYLLGSRTLIDNILQEILKLDLQNSIYSMWLPDSFTEMMLYICYPLTQKTLGIFFTKSSSSHFLHISILYNLIWDFHTYIPRQVRRSHLFESFCVVPTLGLGYLSPL